MDRDEDILRDAETIDHQLRMIRRAMVQGFEADKSRAGLTAPQLQAMVILTRALRDHQDGLTIRGLSERMGLAQSTVSGLVERLERKELVRREVDPSDRRVTRIVLVEKVKTYLDQEVLAKRTGTLAAALERASGHERQAVLEGLAVLYRLLVEDTPS